MSRSTSFGLLNYNILNNTRKGLKSKIMPPTSSLPCSIRESKLAFHGAMTGYESKPLWAFLLDNEVWLKTHCSSNLMKLFNDKLKFPCTSSSLVSATWLPDTIGYRWYATSPRVKTMPQTAHHRSPRLALGLGLGDHTLLKSLGKQIDSGSETKTQWFCDMWIVQQKVNCPPWRKALELSVHASHGNLTTRDHLLVPVIEITKDT